MRRRESLSERITPRLLLLLAVGGALLMVTPQRAGADPSNANCKPNRAGCTANHQCCSGFCDTTVAQCATPPTTTSTTTTSTTTTSSTTTSTTTTTTSSTTTTTPRFVDNGDGTVTDNDTGLQWEKKVQNVCSNNANTVCTSDADCPGGSCAGCLHCVNDLYQWSSSGTAPDGGAFTSFLNTLNGGATGVGNCVSSDGSSQTGGFVNHCDWRLPTSAELLTIVDTSVAGCGSSPFTTPCIDPIFGPTAARVYWSSTTLAGNPGAAWLVFFSDGFVTTGGKFNFFFVRAVRGGS